MPIIRPRRSYSLIAFAVLAALPGVAQTSSTSTAGAVFTMTNAVHMNEVVMYSRSSSGQLTASGRFNTGGRGSGGTADPLESQNSLILTQDHSFLLAVNAGTGDISVFGVTNSGLNLLSVTPSGGGGPISLAVYHNLVYVINYVGNYHTAGFTLLPNGQLQGIVNSRQPLSTLDVGACTIGFTPDGTKLVVTERISNKIDVFTVNSDGSLSNPVYNASAGVAPFGLEFTASGTLLVTETNGGPPAPGTTSSYSINPDNTVTVVSPKADAAGQATCWIRIANSYAWVSDSATGNIGLFQIASGGALTSLGSVAASSATSVPVDSALSADGKFFYVFYAGLGKVFGYSIASTTGALTPLTAAVAGAPSTGMTGLAAY